MTVLESLTASTIYLDGDICSNCRHRADCCIRQRPGRKPIFFCEEFETVSGPSREGAGTYGFVRPLSAQKSRIQDTDLKDAYIGLCRTCANLPRCNFSKPGGGTWACAAYEEKPNRS